MPSFKYECVLKLEQKWNAEMKRIRYLKRGYYVENLYL